MFDDALRAFPLRADAGGLTLPPPPYTSISEEEENENRADFAHGLSSADRLLLRLQRLSVTATPRLAPTGQLQAAAALPANSLSMTITSSTSTHATHLSTAGYDEDHRESAGGQRWMLMLGFGECGSLRLGLQAVESRTGSKVLPEWAAIHLAIEVLRALSALHQADISHGCVCIDHVRMSKDGHVVLSSPAEHLFCEQPSAFERVPSQYAFTPNADINALIGMLHRLCANENRQSTESRELPSVVDVLEDEARSIALERSHVVDDQLDCSTAATRCLDRLLATVESHTRLASSSGRFAAWFLGFRSRRGLPLPVFPFAPAAPAPLYRDALSSDALQERLAKLESDCVFVVPLASRRTAGEVVKKTIVIIGTAHVSKQSVHVVHDTILSADPDSVIVELCKERMDMVAKEIRRGRSTRPRLKPGERGSSTSNVLPAPTRSGITVLSTHSPNTSQVFPVEPAVGSEPALTQRNASVPKPALSSTQPQRIKQVSDTSSSVVPLRDDERAFSALSSGMSWWYSRVAGSLDVDPGAEFVEAVRTARTVADGRTADRGPLNVVLGDRNVKVTLLRCWAALSLREKFSILGEMLGDLNISAEDVEQMKGTDMIETLVAELRDRFPRLAGTLLSERDMYLALSALASRGPVVVCVVGLGHARGMRNFLLASQSRDQFPAVENRHLFSVAHIVQELENLDVVPAQTMTVRRFAAVAVLLLCLAIMLGYFFVWWLLPVCGVPVEFTLLLLCVLGISHDLLFSTTVREQLETSLEKRRAALVNPPEVPMDLVVQKQ